MDVPNNMTQEEFQAFKLKNRIKMLKDSLRLQCTQVIRFSSGFMIEPADLDIDSQTLDQIRDIRRVTKKMYAKAESVETQEKLEEYHEKMKPFLNLFNKNLFTTLPSEEYTVYMALEAEVE